MFTDTFSDLFGSSPGVLVSASGLFDAHPNFAYSTVAVAPSPATSGVTLTVQPGDGAEFSEFPFDVTIWPPNTMAIRTDSEIARITNQVGDVLTLVRHVDGGPARAIQLNDQIAVTSTRRVFERIERRVSAFPAVFSQAGTVFTTPGRNPWPISGAASVAYVDLTVNTAPTSADLVIQLRRNGSPMFSDPARPKIVVGASSPARVRSAVPDLISTVADGDFLTCDYVEGGAASDLTVVAVFV